MTDYNKNNGLEILFRLISLPEYYLLGKLFKKKKKKKSSLRKRAVQQAFISCAETGRKQLQPLPLLEQRTVYCLYCTMKKMKVSSFALSRGRYGKVQHEATHPDCTVSTTLYLMKGEVESGKQTQTERQISNAIVGRIRKMCCFDPP